MSIFENNGEYYANYSVPEISFCNRKASSAEFRKYCSEHPIKKEAVPDYVIEELKKMPSARPAGIDYYTRLNIQLLDKFCQAVASEITLKKSCTPNCLKVISGT